MTNINTHLRCARPRQQNDTHQQETRGGGTAEHRRVRHHAARGVIRDGRSRDGFRDEENYGTPLSAPRNSPFGQIFEGFPTCGTLASARRARTLSCGVLSCDVRESSGTRSDTRGEVSRRDVHLRRRETILTRSEVDSA